VCIKKVAVSSGPSSCVHFLLIVSSVAAAADRLLRLMSVAAVVVFVPFFFLPSLLPRSFLFVVRLLHAPIADRFALVLQFQRSCQRRPNVRIVQMSIGDTLILPFVVPSFFRLAVIIDIVTSR
jgi:hypothetical protein